jgi:hypothetical protein
MRLFDRLLGSKILPFPQFCEVVRQAVRKTRPEARIQSTENGFQLDLEGEPVTCHLRGLYGAYQKTPGDQDVLIKQWISALLTPVPVHDWEHARLTLHPCLKDDHFMTQANRGLAKSNDALPAAPFLDGLHVVVLRDLPGKAAFVTQADLDRWSVQFETAHQTALNNFNMLSFPVATNSMVSSGSLNAREADPVGLVFEGDHLTATWVIMERFRDFLVQKLQGDCLVFVPHRSKLVALRADEPGLINPMLGSIRVPSSDPHALNAEPMLVTATTGGEVSVYRRAPIIPGTAPPVRPASVPKPDAAPAFADIPVWTGRVEATTEFIPPSHDPKGRKEHR